MKWMFRPFSNNEITLKKKKTIKLTLTYVYSFQFNQINSLSFHNIEVENTMQYYIWHYILIVKQCQGLSGFFEKHPSSENDKELLLVYQKLRGICEK